MLNLHTKFLAFLTASSVLLFAGQSFAQSGAKKSKPSKSPKKSESEMESDSSEDEKPRRSASPKLNYGMAGCGLGALIIKDDDTWPQVGSHLINAAACQFGICQTFAISSGTMGCTDEELSAEVSAEKDVYVQVNYDQMSKEAAQGGGEHLRAYASEILGCDESGVNHFSQLSRIEFDSLYGTGSHRDVVEGYDRLLTNDAALRASCNQAG
jgi:hypothetical protein